MIAAKACLLSLEPRLCNLLIVENLQPDFMNSEKAKNNSECSKQTQISQLHSDLSNILLCQLAFSRILYITSLGG